MAGTVFTDATSRNNGGDESGDLTRVAKRRARPGPRLRFATLTGLAWLDRVAR